MASVYSRQHSCLPRLSLPSARLFRGRAAHSRPRPAIRTSPQSTEIMPPRDFQAQGTGAIMWDNSSLWEPRGGPLTAGRSGVPHSPFTTIEQAVASDPAEVLWGGVFS